ATFACEFQAVFNENQAWYCDKLPILGIESVYDDAKKANHPSPPRCLYVSANEYTLYDWNPKNTPTPIADLKTVKG
ncbi:hypothetical protein PENTCL1PPCAC_5142, partial [Pristionchus entomophagus]